MYSGSAMWASQVDMGLEFPLTATTLRVPVTTNPEAQDRAPESCWPQAQGYHLCLSQIQPPPVSRILGVSEAGSSLVVKAPHLNHPDSETDSPDSSSTL